MAAVLAEPRFRRSTAVLRFVKSGLNDKAEGIVQGFDFSSQTFEGAAHIVQLSLAPVFLLSGLAALLNVFANRLARVADQADRLADAPKDPVRDRRLNLLRFRANCLDWAVVLAALAGALTCGAVLSLFLGAFRLTGASETLFLCFGGAIVLSMCALAAYVLEMLTAARGIRRLVDKNVRAVDPTDWR